MTKEQPAAADPQPPQKEVDKSGDDKRRDDEVRQAPAPAYRITDWAAF